MAPYPVVGLVPATQRPMTQGRHVASRTARPHRGRRAQRPSRRHVPRRCVSKTRRDATRRPERSRHVLASQGTDERRRGTQRRTLKNSLKVTRFCQSNGYNVALSDQSVGVAGQLGSGVPWRPGGSQCLVRCSGLDMKPQLAHALQDKTNVREKCLMLFLSITLPP